jgi:hypothetical protein
VLQTPGISACSWKLVIDVHQQQLFRPVCQDFGWTGLFVDSCYSNVKGGAWSGALVSEETEEGRQQEDAQANAVAAISPLQIRTGVASDEEEDEEEGGPSWDDGETDLDRSSTDPVFTAGCGNPGAVGIAGEAVVMEYEQPTWMQICASHMVHKRKWLTGEVNRITKSPWRAEKAMSFASFDTDSWGELLDASW